MIQTNISSNVSIIVPVLNEAETLSATLQRVTAELMNGDELIVVDGGSTDGTTDIAWVAGARVIVSALGRGAQMAAGVKVTSQPALLFLHADTLLTTGWREAIATTLAADPLALTAFSFRTDGDGWRYRVLEKLVMLRCRWLKLPYGDQAFFLMRDQYERCGGFPDWPLMEDMALVQRMKRCASVKVLSLEVITSARRCRKFGFFTSVLSNQAYLLAYTLGVQPQTLARWRS